MRPLQTMPAIRRIDTDRDTLLAVDVVGHVSAADAENLFGLLEAAYALHPKIDVLVRLVEYDGVEWSELSKDTLTRGKADALDHVARCATIGEPDWSHVARGLFAAPSVDIRHFDASDEASAWAWLGARPIDPDV